MTKTITKWIGDGAITKEKLNPDVAGVAIIGGSGDPLDFDIPSLTEETSPHEDDFLAIYDVSVAAHRKATLANVLAAADTCDCKDFFVQDIAESSTTSGVFVQKARLTFTPPETAYYEISFACLMTSESNNQNVECRLEINDATEKFKATTEVKALSYGDGAWQPICGKFAMEFTNTSYDIDLDYRSIGNGKLSYIKEALIVARKLCL